MRHITDKEQFESGAMRFDLIDGKFYLLVSLEPNYSQDYCFNIEFVNKLAAEYHDTGSIQPADTDKLIQLASDILELLKNQHNSAYHAWERLALLLAHGANKYSDRNWEKGMPIKRTFASLCRHLFKYQHELETGERIDNEDHGAAVLFNIMAVLHTWRNYGNRFDVEKNNEPIKVWGNVPPITYDESGLD